MKNFLKGKFGTVIILFFTLILAGVAIFTALRLYQLRSTSVAPNVPSSIPQAAEITPSPTPGACTLSFTLLTATASPTATATSTGSPTASPTASPTGSPGPTGAPNSCGGTCGSNTNCGEGLYCYTTLGFCRNPSCPTQANCICSGTSTPTPGHTGTPRPTSAPTPTAPALPVSGTDWPTILGAGIGIFVIIGSLLLAL